MTTTGSAALRSSHALPPGDVLAALQSDPRRGLDDDEAARRRLQHGPNELEAHQPRTPLAILLHQLAGPVVALLGAAVAISLLLADWAEAFAILLVLAINTAIGFATELKAERSLEALRRLGAQSQRVRRGGAEVMVAASDLVPGDIALLEEGDIITADMRLLNSQGAASDESSLTGESVPVAKAAEAVAERAMLADRSSMLFKGTALARGAAEAVVTATGRQTELGQIAALAIAAKPEASPLTRKLASLSQDLVTAVLAIAAVIALAGIAQGQDLLLMVKTAISLAVAAIPEGLPIVSTLVLARGMLRMAERNAVIERLAAVETLGATTVILTDKTGTLTENRMSVSEIVTATGSVNVRAAATEGPPALLAHQPDVRRLLAAAALCTSAGIADDGATARPAATPPGTPAAPRGRGDPMEIALLELAARAGISRAALVAAQPEVGRIAFDSESKIMLTAHQEGSLVHLAVKGAPEAVLARSTRLATEAGDLPFGPRDHETWLARVHALGRRGLRVLAVAERRELSFDSAAAALDLTLLGLVALEDPPRADVPAAIAACRDAGIKVVMVTGDHAGTAQAIARATGFGPGEVRVVEGHELEMHGPEATAKALAADVLARVTPRQKLELVEAYQARGEIVAMTGDGVNDAPALKKADIGIAMGQRGTDVARQAAAMILRDDAFPTIVEAVRQGRVIFGNIRRFVIYLLACNLAEVLVVSLAVLAGMPLPLQPIQILFLNVVTDVFPALALAMGEGSRDVLKHPPRPPAEPLLARRHWVLITTFGLIITAATLAAMQLALGEAAADRPAAATAVAFITLALTQMLFAFNMVDGGEGWAVNSVTRNPYVWAATALCTALLTAAIGFEPLARLLKLQAPSMEGLATATGASVAAMLAGAVAVRLLRRLPGAG